MHERRNRLVEDDLTPNQNQIECSGSTTLDQSRLLADQNEPE